MVKINNTVASKFYKKLLSMPHVFFRMTGVKIEDFQRIVNENRPAWKRLQKKKKCHGRNSKVATLEERLMLLLLRYRSNITYPLLGMFFNIDGSNIYRILTQLESILIKKLHIEKDPTLTEEELKKVLIVDTTTIKIPRPSKNPKKFYSGKHKDFVVKFEILTDPTGKIVKISQLYSGPNHDFKIRMNEFKIPRNITLLADSGYQGYQKIHKKTILPTKRTKKKKLSKVEKEQNRKIAKQRIVIEHVFASMKRFKIIGSLYRDNLKKLSKIINIIAGIHNLNIK